jgi:PKD domain-containing protein
MLIVATTIIGSFTFPTLLHATIFNHSHGDAAQHDALAASLPLFVDSNYHLKERAGDANAVKSALQVDENFVDPENHCEFCTRLVYKPGQQGVAGIAYSTSGNSLDLSDAKSVHFFARGEKGGEKVKFEAAGKDIASLTSGSTNDNLFSNIKFAMATKTVTLSDIWKSYTIDVGDSSRTDLTDITHPFAIDVLKGNGGGQKQVVIYVKAVVFDTKQEANALTTTLTTTTTITIPGANNTATTTSDNITTNSASENATGSARPITVSATANTTEGTTSTAIRFGGKVISGGSPPYSYKWDFDDGHKSKGKVVSHTFERTGKYNVAVTVSDSKDQTASANMPIEIKTINEALTHKDASTEQNAPTSKTTAIMNATNTNDNTTDKAQSNNDTQNVSSDDTEEG